MLVLGVDPGSIVTGYGLVEKRNNRMVCIHADTMSPSKGLPFFDPFTQVLYLDASHPHGHNRPEIP